MRRIVLLRGRSTAQGTPGVLFREDGSIFGHTIELPWRENARRVSCIPPGDYLCVRRKSPKFGLVYEVRDVPERSNILIHSGNTIFDTLGCILPGLYRGAIAGRLAVLSSRSAVSNLDREMEGRPFRLQVISWKEESSGLA